MKEVGSADQGVPRLRAAVHLASQMGARLGAGEVLLGALSPARTIRMSQWDRELPSACPGDGFTVYYDGACPLCAKEIDSYRRLQGADAIDWIDVSPCESVRLGGDLDRDAALMRLHVRCADGTLIDGAAAFATLRQQLPALARMGRLASQPVLLAVLESGYAAFLRVRVCGAHPRAFCRKPSWPICVPITPARPVQ